MTACLSWLSGVNILFGIFSNTMLRMEVSRRSFITHTKLKGGVKIAHFNSKTMYIDLNNEYDHATVWNKRYMYIQEIPSQEHPATQSIGITSINPPAPLEKCVDSVAQNHPNPSTPPVANVDSIEVIGGKKDGQEKPIVVQDVDPKGVGVPHVLHERVVAPGDPRMDQIPHATTSQYPGIQETPYTQAVACVISSSTYGDHTNKVDKGKTTATSEITTTKPKNNPNTQKGNISDTIQRVEGVESRSEVVQAASATPVIHSAPSEHVFSQVDSIPLKNVVHEEPVNEKCHHKKFSPSRLGLDVYNHVQSEDEVDFGDEVDDEHSVDLEEEDTCNKLLTTINSATDVDKVVGSHGLSPRSKPPHYHARSKASSIKAPPKSVTPKQRP
ncbi:hypothetical protein A4A49_09983 [Nicotiana attenuata]|uniref:DUF4283 domain-containing protein n=1 Tax=Nicotiana attenuata TaxID=49451 RepID=A0A314L8I5_NICAT|nr:hypothetical protein A4A49_09983 [Nicotiana attenuata]